MFFRNRFTQRAEQALQLARQTAGELGHSYVGSELSGKSNVAAKQAKKTKQTFNSQSFNAYSIENNNYVSIRELCDAFGVQISYDALTNSVNMQVK